MWTHLFNWEIVWWKIVEERLRAASVNYDNDLIELNTEKDGFVNLKPETNSVAFFLTAIR